MSEAGIIGVQVLVMLMLIVTGIICVKTKLVNKTGIRDMTNVLLYVVAPVLIVNSYQTPYDNKSANQLFWTFILAFVMHIAAIAVCSLIIRKRPDQRYKVERFGAIYSNCGFMGYPLLFALFGQHGIFLGAAVGTVFTIFNWTHGVFLLKGKTDTKTTLRQVFLNPGVIGFITGIVLYVTNIRFPAPVLDTMQHIGNLNTPLAMIVTGTFIFQVNWKGIYKEYRVFIVVLLKLIVMPVVMLLILLPFNVDKTVLAVILVTTACPSAAATSFFVGRFGHDGVYGSKMVAVTTLLSVATLPLMVLLFVR